MLHRFIFDIQTLAGKVVGFEDGNHTIFFLCVSCICMTLSLCLCVLMLLCFYLSLIVSSCLFSRSHASLSLYLPCLFVSQSVFFTAFLSLCLYISLWQADRVECLCLLICLSISLSLSLSFLPHLVFLNVCLTSPSLSVFLSLFCFFRSPSLPVPTVVSFS